MQVFWNPQQMGQVFVLPRAVAEQHIRLAGVLQLKVLLWLSASGGGIFDAEACAAAVGRSAEECADALQYWLETGVLCRADAPVPPAVTAAPMPSAKPTPVKAPAAIPRAVKPTMEQVVQMREGDERLGVLFDSVSARLGKPLSPSDMMTLAYLFDTAGLPVEVILMVVGYAAEQGKLSMRYIEKTALGWADDGLTDIASAEQYLCSLEKQKQCGEQVGRLFGLEAPLTRAQCEQAVQWLTEWEMSEALLMLAYDQCVQKTGKCQFNYIHKVLAHWYNDGVTEPQQVHTTVSRKQKVRETSMDTDAYERQLIERIPVFKKRKE